MDFENTESFEDTISKILEYKEKGYFFHGSPKSDLDILEPKQSSDVDITNTFNIDCAVFASTIPEACIFSLLGTDNVPENLLGRTMWVKTSLDGHIQAEIPLIWKPYMENNTGTLYILPPEPFNIKNDEWQVKSKLSVKPIDRISVGFKHFERLGGKLVWEEEQGEIKK